MAAQISFPPKIAKFCHNSNRFLLGCDATVRYCSCILIPLQLVGRSVGRLVGRSTIKVPEVWEVSIQKDENKFTFKLMCVNLYLIIDELSIYIKTQFEL